VPFSRVEKVYYVNLEESKERREATEHVLSENSEGIPFERWPAVPKSEAVNATPYKEILQARNVSAWFYSAMTNGTGNGSSRFPGMVGCYMSHRMLLRHINETATNPDAVYVVMEDDVNVKKGWHQRLEAVWPSVPDGWDVLKIGYWGSEWPCDEVAKGVYLARLAGGKSKVMGCSHNYAGTQAYVVTARSAGRVLSVLDEEEIRDIDQLLCTGLQCAWRIPGRKTPMVYALSDLKPYFKEELAPLKNSYLSSALFLWDAERNATVVSDYRSLQGPNATMNMTWVRQRAFYNGTHAFVNDTAVPWSFHLNSSIGRLAKWDVDINNCSANVQQRLANWNADVTASKEDMGCTPLAVRS
jgi:GR25 family glycosyltransferase involved in LPS biosynthesis